MELTGHLHAQASSHKAKELLAVTERRRNGSRAPQFSHSKRLQYLPEIDPKSFCLLIVVYSLQTELSLLQRTDLLHEVQQNNMGTCDECEKVVDELNYMSIVPLTAFLNNQTTKIEQGTRQLKYCQAVFCYLLEGLINTISTVSNCGKGKTKKIKES